MEYILLMYNNSESTPTNEEWDLFIQKAIESKRFNGGSAIADAQILGKKKILNYLISWRFYAF